MRKLSVSLFALVALSPALAGQAGSVVRYGAACPDPAFVLVTSSMPRIGRQFGVGMPWGGGSSYHYVVIGMAQVRVPIVHPLFGLSGPCHQLVSFDIPLMPYVGLPPGIWIPNRTSLSGAQFNLQGVRLQISFGIPLSLRLTDAVHCTVGS